MDEVFAAIGKDPKTLPGDLEPTDWLILADMSRRERRDSDDISRPMERRSRPYDDEGRRSDYRRPLMPPPGSTPRGPRGGGPPQRRRGIAIDRAQTCPFLLRVFYRMGSHHNDGDF
ncbi:Histone deacetylase complex subunit sap18, partial [Perkinsus olseni]